MQPPDLAVYPEGGYQQTAAPSGNKVLVRLRTALIVLSVPQRDVRQERTQLAAESTGEGAESHYAVGAPGLSL